MPEIERLEAPNPFDLLARREFELSVRMEELRVECQKLQQMNGEGTPIRNRLRSLISRWVGNGQS